MTLDAPVLVTVTASGWLWPTVTSPKLRAVGFDPRTPGAGGELFALTPWHPLSRSRAAEIMSTPHTAATWLNENLLRAVFDMLFR